MQSVGKQVQKMQKTNTKKFFINESGLRNGKSKIGDNEINATVSSSRVIADRFVRRKL